eukprot:146175-Prorocentrum_minimum.AAC.10
MASSVLSRCSSAWSAACTESASTLPPPLCKSRSARSSASTCARVFDYNSPPGPETFWGVNDRKNHTSSSY